MPRFLWVKIEGMAWLLFSGEQSMNFMCVAPSSHHRDILTIALADHVSLWRWGMRRGREALTCRLTLTLLAAGGGCFRGGEGGNCLGHVPPTVNGVGR